MYSIPVWVRQRPCIIYSWGALLFSFQQEMLRVLLALEQICSEWADPVSDLAVK